MLHTRPLLGLHLELSPPLALGIDHDSTKRQVAVRGGRVTGALEGKVLPSSSEVHAMRADGVSEISSRYVVELEDGSCVEISAEGVRVPRAESVPPSAELTPRAPRGYYRMHVRFLCAAPEHVYLNSLLAVGVGTHGRELVTLDVHAIE
jgi:hypothetical protein